MTDRKEIFRKEAERNIFMLIGAFTRNGFKILLVLKDAAIYALPGTRYNEDTRTEILWKEEMS